MTGRYVQSDPIGLDGGINGFIYVDGNPFIRYDSSGQWFGIDDAFTGPVDELLVFGGLTIAYYLGSDWAGEALDDLNDFFSGPSTTTLPDNGMYNTEGGNATEPAPYDHLDENDALNTPPGSHCDTIRNAIVVLRAQIAWRYTDLNPRSNSYAGHLKRIRILEARLKELEGYYNAFCK